MLEVKDLSVSYGRHRALDGVALRVDKGEICVILGANGAGKSTLLKAIAGMVRAESGSVVMNGKPITAMKPHRVVEEGIALVPEGRGIFGDLTVAENLQLGAYAARARAYETAMLAEIYRLFPRLAERKGQVARTMSGGEQQMVAIGRALMSKPDILMLDEPSLGLSPRLSQELFRSLKEIAKSGVGILLVEQNARQSLKISDRGYLIENGHVAGENTAEALMNNPAVINAYLGGAGAKPQGQAEPRKWTPSGVLFGMERMGRLIDELVARAERVQRMFIRSLRRKRTVPSAFIGRYEPAAEQDFPQDVVAEKQMPMVSSDARALSKRAAELASQASERLALHISSRRMASPAFGARDGTEASDADRMLEADRTKSLIGHNSRFAMDDEPSEPETAETQPMEEAAPTADRSAGWPVSDGIGALVAKLSARQRAPGRKAGWPVSDGIAAVVAQAAAKQVVSKSPPGKQLSAFTVAPSGDEDGDSGMAERQRLQSWPVTGGIGTLIRQAQGQNAQLATDSREETLSDLVDFRSAKKLAKAAKKEKRRKHKEE